MTRLGLALVVATAACSGEPVPPAAPIAASSTATPWVEVRPAAGHALLEAPAIALGDPEQRAELAVPSRARVTRVLVAPGDEVVRDAPLVEVVYPELAASAAAYLAALDQLAAQDRRRAQLEALRAEGLARAGELSSVEVEQARLRGERDLAVAALRGAGVDPALARGLVDAGGRSRLRAPIAGVVVKVDASLGQLRAPDGGPLVELAAAGVHRVEAQLTQALPDGAPLVFVPVGGAARPAVVLRAEPRRAADGTRRLWLAVDGAGLIAGQPGRVRATLGDDVVAVPATALARDPAGELVWRRAGDGRERLAVTVLARSGADALVRGPRRGDLIAARAAEVAR